MPNHAVVIGINNYPGISPLEGPCNDATEFLKWVTQPGPGNVDPGNVHKLLSSEFTSTTDVKKARPVSDQIEEKFTEVLNGNLTQHIGDRLYVFVAGHGMSDVNRADAAALIAANASRQRITMPHVVVTDYIHFFRRSYTFSEIILVMDCCLDASVLRPLNVTGCLQGNPHPNASKVRLFLAKATVWSKKSFEKKFNGTTRGIFSVALMEALEKVPAEGAKVTGKAIKNYIEQHIKTIAGDKEIEDPDIGGRGHEKVVFYERSDSQAHETATAFRIRIKIDNAAGNEVVDLFGENRVLLESKISATDVVEFQVAAGIYKVAIQGTNRSTLIEVVTDHEETL
jgi:hypothetical protein